MIKRNAGPDYGMNIYQVFTIDSAEFDDNGDIVGVWKYEPTDYLLKITFGGSLQNRPSEIVWLKPDQRSGKHKILSVIKTRWGHIESSKGKAGPPVPVEVERLDHYANGTPRRLHVHCRWKELPNDFEFPKHGDLDWREPFRGLFDVEPGWPMAEWDERSRDASDRN